MYGAQRIVENFDSIILWDIQRNEKQWIKPMILLERNTYEIAHPLQNVLFHDVVRFIFATFSSSSENVVHACIGRCYDDAVFQITRFYQRFQYFVAGPVKRTVGYKNSFFGRFGNYLCNRFQ